MKLPKSSPDKLPAEGNSKLRKLFKSFRVLSSNNVTITSQTIPIVTTSIRKIDFCNERHNINGQNRLNNVVITRYE